MQADPLQQLRDIHLPVEPGWWPPAPGWWLLILVLLGLLLYAALRWRGYYQHRAPQRYAVQLYRQLHQRYTNQEISSQTYVNGTNQILKRLLIHQLQNENAVQASDTSWLHLLDETLGGSQFTDGPGQVLGNARFAPTVTLEADAFDELIRKLLAVKLS